MALQPRRLPSYTVRPHYLWELSLPEVGQSWHRIVAWYREHALRSETVRGPVWQRDGDPSDWSPPEGASEASIARAEQEMGLRFPDDLRASYLLHDGSEEALLPWGYHLLSHENIVQEWKKLRSFLETENYDREPKGPIQPVHWNTRWIPVASNDSGDYHFVDLDPAPGGTSGQVFHHSHEVGPTRVLAQGFAEWLADYANQLEVGVYSYDAYDGWILRDDTGEWYP